MKLCGVSLKYAPVMFSHLVSFCQPMQEAGHSVNYLFSADYRWIADDFGHPLNVTYLGHSRDIKTMLYDTVAFHTSGLGKVHLALEAMNSDILFFGNMHPANAQLAAMARKKGCREIWWWLHEPYVREKKLHGRSRSYYITLLEFLQGRFLRHVDRVIVSSEEAIRQFNQVFPWFRGKVIKVPLILLDYYEELPLPLKRYITFVGSAVQAKGIETFFNLIEYAEAQNSPLPFQIITSTNIKAALAQLSVGARARLKVVSDTCISDRQLGKALRDSLAVITPYKRVTQSGVVPVAFMHAVPIISTSIGAMSEAVYPGKTGVLLPPDAPLEAWLQAAESVRQDRENLGYNCRTFYNEYFSPRNWHKVLSQLFN
jgi:glycosyltransferase involved in cell wall biosynthesis